MGGWSLIVAAAAFMIVFTWLAAAFNYPDVLDGRASDVLPSLLTMGATGRAVWSIYGVLPLLLIPAGVGAHAALRRDAPALSRAALALVVISALAMMLGLLRWPSIHWVLATAHAAAGSEAERVAIAAMFDGLNSYLGNFIGEFVGEMTLNLFFLLVALASAKSDRMPRWSIPAGIVAALLGLIGMWRNVTPVVGVVADIENYVLPVWMVILGVLLVRSGARSHGAPAGG